MLTRMAGVPPSTALPGAEMHGVFGPPLRALTVGLIVVVTLVAFEALAVATVMPAVERDLGGLRLYGWTFGAFLLASLVGIAWAGAQADRRGPARPFAVGLTLFGIGLLIAGLAPTMSVVVGGRVVQGLGAGALPAIAYVVIGRAYRDALRPRMFALLSTAWIVPGLAGPALAGLVAEYASWRIVFLGLVPLLMALGAVVVRPLMRLGPPAVLADSADSTLIALRLAAGAGLALAGLSLLSVPGLALVAVGVAVGVPAFRRLVPPGTLRAARGLPAAIAGMGLVNMAFLGADPFLPLMLTAVRGRSIVYAGLVLTVATVAWTAGAWLQERLAPRWSRRASALIGAVLIAVGLGITAATTWSLVPTATAAVGWAIAAFGMGIAYQSFSLIVLGQAPPGREGEAISGLKLSETLGTALGAGVGGVLVAVGATDGPRAEFVAATFVLMAAAALIAAIAARRAQVADVPAFEGR